MIEEVRQHYKQRMEEQRRRMEEINSQNESLSTEMVNIQASFVENSSVKENRIVQLQNDMRVVKEEWEKRCHEIEHGLQQEIVSEFCMKN